MKLNVTQTVQAPGNDPVTISWGRGITEIQAAAAVAQILAQGDDDDSTVPASVRPHLVNINITLAVNW